MGSVFTGNEKVVKAIGPKEIGITSREENSREELDKLQLEYTRKELERAKDCFRKMRDEMNSRYYHGAYPPRYREDPDDFAKRYYGISPAIDPVTMAPVETPEKPKEPPKPKFSFKELDWKAQPDTPITSNSWFGIKFFNNGYGIKVLYGGMAKTGPTGPYEVQVLEGSAEDYSICYNTKITDDVISNCTAERVTELMNEIGGLE